MQPTTRHTTNTLTLLSGHRFGFNGQEKDDEVIGDGNAYTAEFWEYDARLGRRFNLDPKPNLSISPYACFANNPIIFTDPNGDTVKYNSFWDRVRVGIGRLIDRDFNDRFKAQKQSDLVYTYKTVDNRPTLLSASPDYGRKLSVQEVLNGDWKKYNVEYSLGSFININLFEGEKPIEFTVNKSNPSKTRVHNLSNVASNHPIEIFPHGHPDNFVVTNPLTGATIVPSQSLANYKGVTFDDPVNNQVGTFSFTLPQGTTQLRISSVSKNVWPFTRNSDGTRSQVNEDFTKYTIRYWKKTSINIRF